MARPMGTPCKKYSTTSNRKFRRSLGGRFWKLVVVIVGVPGPGTTGGSWSKEKDGRDIRRAVRSAEVSVDGVSRLRISILLFMAPFAWPFWPVATFKLGLERRLERVADLRVIEMCPVLLNFGRRSRGRKSGRRGASGWQERSRTRSNRLGARQSDGC